MADRLVESSATEVPEIDEELQKVLLFALDEARTQADQGEDVTPFTALVVKDNVFLEKHPGPTPQYCFNEARHTVEGVSGAGCYAFCYDGYVETDTGMVDALIAEGGVPGQPEGTAVGLIYHEDDEGHYHFEPEVAYIGPAPNFMAHLAQPDQVVSEDTPYDLADAQAEEFPTMAEAEAALEKEEDSAESSND